MIATQSLLVVICFTLVQASEESKVYEKELTTRHSNMSRNDMESLLHKYLFDGYQKDVHPLMEGNLTQNKAVSVTFDAQVIRILQVNEREQYIKVYLWVNQYWQNPLLTWDPAKYAGIKSVHASPALVWVPDIVLYNSVDANGQFSGGLDVYKHKVHIHSDGRHSWLNPVVFKSICELDVSYFPFDDQECRLKFGSWAHDASKLITKSTVQSNNANSYYIRNGEWKLLSIKTQENKKYYQCCKNPFADVTVTMWIRRQAINYAFTLILPCALLSSLVVLGFILPPESGERIGLSITVLLAVTVFQQLTSQIMPPYDFPYLAQYYLATIMETAISLVITTLILNLYHRSNRRMPGWVKKILLDGLAPVLFCQRTKKLRDDDDESLDADLISPKTFENKCAASVPEVIVDSNGRKPFHNDQETSFDSDTDTIENGDCYAGSDSPSYSTRVRRKFNGIKLCRRSKHPSAKSAICKSLQSTAFALLDRETGTKMEQYEKKKRRELERKRRAREWLKAARTLDRLFFILFVIISTATLLVIFFRAPRFSNDSGEK